MATTLKELESGARRFLKPEKHFFLSKFGEVELGIVEGLKPSVYSELRRSLPQVVTFVELTHETLLSWNNLCFERSDIILEKASSHSILPLTH